MIFLTTGLIFCFVSCKQRGYVTEEKNANLKIGAFILYAHEKIEVVLNGQLVLSDINRNDSNRYHYMQYLKVDYRSNNNISLKSFLKDSLVLDTSIVFQKELDKYLLMISASYPRKIGLDSLNRMKFPYKLGYIPIEESARVISFLPDTLSWNDVLTIP